MSTFWSDSCTDADGTVLTSHTGEVGATYTAATGSGSGSAQITDAGRVRAGGTSFGRTYGASGTPATAEYDVEADYRYFTTAGECGIAARVVVAANQCYLVRHNGTAWQLVLRNSDNGTVLGSFSQSLSAGQTYRIRFEVRNATKKVFVDGVERISSTDNTLTGAGVPGVRVTGTQSNTTGIHVDNLTAYDPIASGRPGVYLRLLQQHVLGA